MKKILSDTFVYGLSSVIGKMSFIYLLPLYSRYFTVTEYGVLAIITIFYAFVMQFVILQLDSGVFRFINEDKSDNSIKKCLSTWFFTQIILSFAVIAICFCFRDLIGLLLLDTTEYNTLIILSIINIPFFAVEIITTNLWRITFKKWSVTIFTLASVFANVLLNYIFISYLNKGLLGVAYSSIALSVVKAIFLLPLIAKYINIKYFEYDLLKKMLTFTFPLVVSGYSITILTLIDRVILEKFTSAESVGIYQMANNIALLINVPVSAFLMAWSPYVFSILEEKNHKKIIGEISTYFVGITSFFAFAITMFSSEFIYFFSEVKFLSAANYISILLFANLLMGVYQISGIGCAIIKDTKPIMWATLISMALNIVLNLVLIPFYHLYGASWASLLSYLFIPVYLFRASQKRYEIPFNFLLMLLLFTGFFITSYSYSIHINDFHFDLYSFIYKIITLLILFAISSSIIYFFKVRTTSVIHEKR